MQFNKIKNTQEKQTLFNTNTKHNTEEGKRRKRVSKTTSKHRIQRSEHAGQINEDKKAI